MPVLPVVPVLPVFPVFPVLPVEPVEPVPVLPVEPSVEDVLLVVCVVSSLLLDVVPVWSLPVPELSSVWPAVAEVDALPVVLSVFELSLQAATSPETSNAHAATHALNFVLVFMWFVGSCLVFRLS